MPVAPSVTSGPIVRRWAAIALAAAVLVAVAPAPAAAHAEHQPLPTGFEARITQVLDAAGRPADPAVDFTMATDGGGVTVTYRGAGELIVDGEQAGEELVRIAGGEVAVNSASPQAVQVQGATVNPAAAAELIDLVWDRVTPVWEPVPGSGTVSFMDHRAVPGHPPVRGDFQTGDVAATWNIPFTLDGEAYTLTGEVVAVEVPRSLSTLVIVAGAALGALVVALVLRRRRASRAGAPPARPGTTAPRSKDELVGA